MATDGDIPIEITASDIRAAADRIHGHVIRTPLIENDALNEIAGGRVLVKAEVLQHCGSFKIRGAFNLISQLSDDERDQGILAWSSGNHAQGIARAAQIFGANATIIMPADAPAMKLDKVRSYGAEIIAYDRYTQDREVIAQEILAARPMALAPSFDHPQIIAGQGTLGLEVLDDAKARGASLDAFIVCCGGGGLTAGCAIALEKSSPQTDVWIAEPEGFDETWASIVAEKRLTADITRSTLCDAIATPSPGKLTFPIMQKLVRGGVTLTDEDVKRAMVFAYKHLKLVVEPGGVVALAAMLSGKFDGRDKATGIVLAGGNVDAPLFASVISKHS